uniref:MARVEL domain-containing protein n=1 Tax=Meloidogyne incognita TaxID=6306 RepID=A0A914NDB0_MELIC
MESSNRYQFEFHEEHQERPHKHFYPRQDPNVTATTIETKYYSREIPPRIYSRNGDNTRRRSNISYNEYDRYESDTLNTKYCIEPAGVLRIIEIIICLIVVCLLTVVYGPGPFKGILFGQTLIMLFTGFALCLTFLILLAYFFNLPQTYLNFWPWTESDILLSGIASIFFLIFSCLEAYYSTGGWANNCNDIGGDGIIHNGCRLIIEWAFASFFFFVLSALYAASSFFAMKERKYEIKEKRRQRNINNDFEN